MSRMNAGRAGRVMLLVVSVAGLLGGCSILFPPTSPEAVLAGTWAVTVQNAPDLKQLLITFNSTGNVTSVSYKLGDNATITVPSPVGVAEVNGTSVTISATFNNNGLTFNGTLNSTNTVITGSLTTQIVVGSVVVTVDNGPATLTKQ